MRRPNTMEMATTDALSHSPAGVLWTLLEAEPQPKKTKSVMATNSDVQPLMSSRVEGIASRGVPSKALTMILRTIG
jgi:hypothetical protein